MIFGVHPGLDPVPPPPLPVGRDAQRRTWPARWRCCGRLARGWRRRWVRALLRVEWWARGVEERCRPRPRRRRGRRPRRACRSQATAIQRRVLKEPPVAPPTLPAVPPVAPPVPPAPPAPPAPPPPPPPPWASATGPVIARMMPVMTSRARKFSSHRLPCECSFVPTAVFR
jgi:hypothetical protein